jgi:hypothetical protein
MSVVVGNSPHPLANAPLELLRDARCQMSFGERAALEGLLQMRPVVSIEVGCAEGGSLARVAAFSGHVHAFDLREPDPDVLALENVTMHLGDSLQTLPDVLASLRRVDFALIDGDHSAYGVRADLLAVLDAASTRRTVILLHDTANPEVLAGLRSIDLDFHPRVVYHELALLAGYEFADGPFAGQMWGGLGLIVTGDRATDGYGETPAQTLYRKRAIHG